MSELNTQAIITLNSDDSAEAVARRFVAELRAVIDGRVGLLVKDARPTLLTPLTAPPLSRGFVGL